MTKKHSSNYSVSSFKAKCLSLIDDVAKKGNPLTITKHGQPLVRVIPIHPPKKKSFGMAKSLLISMGDVTSPIDDNWK